jgi:hypothetical protein
MNLAASACTKIRSPYSLRNSWQFLRLNFWRASHKTTSSCVWFATCPCSFTKHSLNTCVWDRKRHCETISRLPRFEVDSSSLIVSCFVPNSYRFTWLKFNYKCIKMVKTEAWVTEMQSRRSTRISLAFSDTFRSADSSNSIARAQTLYMHCVTL